MKNINFMPWRDTLSIQRRKNLKVLVGLMVLSSVMIIWSWHFNLLTREQSCEQRIANLQTEISQKNAVAESAVSGTKIKHIVATLSLYTTKMNAIFQAIGQSLDSSICFTQIEQHGSQMLFSGEAQSIADLLTYFNRWKVMPFFSEMKIEQLLKKTNATGFEFRFRGLENDTPNLPIFD